MDLHPYLIRAKLDSRLGHYFQDVEPVACLFSKLSSRKPTGLTGE